MKRNRLPSRHFHGVAAEPPFCSSTKPGGIESMGREYNSRLRQRDVFRRTPFESLEPRRVMAGNVTAEVIDGDLIITGDGAANTISVRQSDSGSYVVESD